MGDIDQANYYKLIALLVDVSPKVVRCYFKTHILKGSSFKSYLEKNKHELFHFSSSRKCCQCISLPNKNRKKLSRQHFLLLFQSEVSVPRCGSETECICKYTGKEVDFDLTFLICILANCKDTKHLENTVHNWIVQIQKVRNELFHKCDEHSVSQQNFDSIWNQINDVLLGLAGQVSSLYNEETKKKIEHYKARVVSIEDKLKEITFIKEWYLTKSCENENLLQDVEEFNRSAKHNKENLEQWLHKFKTIDDKIDSVPMQLEEVLCKLRSNKRTKQYFHQEQNDKNTNNIKKTGKTTIPVLLHIEIPPNWDQAQIHVGIEETKKALNTLMGNLKIRYFSTDQQKMLLDIVKCLPDVIDNEIYGLLGKIVKASKIDTSTPASLSATFEVVEEDVPPIPDLSMSALVNAYSQDGDDRINDRWNTFFNEPEAQFYIILCLCRILAFIIFKLTFL